MFNSVRYRFIKQKLAGANQCLQFLFSTGKIAGITIVAFFRDLKFEVAPKARM
jgi:hypothetical protein